MNQLWRVGIFSPWIPWPFVGKWSPNMRIDYCSFYIYNKSNKFSVTNIKQIISNFTTIFIFHLKLTTLSPRLGRLFYWDLRKLSAATGGVYPLILSWFWESRRQHPAGWSLSLLYAHSANPLNVWKAETQSIIWYNC